MPIANPEPGYTYSTTSSKGQAEQKEPNTILTGVSGSTYVPIKATSEGRLYVDALVTASISPGDIEIGAVEIKNATTDTRAIVGAGSSAAVVDDALYVADANVKTALSDGSAVSKIWDGIKTLEIAVDGSGSVANGLHVLGTDGTNAQILKTDSSGRLETLATSIPLASYNIGSDGGIVTYTSANSLTLSGNYPYISNNAQLVYVKQIPTSGSGSAYYVNGTGGITLTESGGVLSINGSSPFVPGSYEVGINAPKTTLDYDLDIQKTIDQSPLWSRYTDKETIVSTAQGLTETWTDIGSEIDMRGYTQCNVYVTLNINDSVNARIKALGKHTSAGAEEYNFVIQTIGSSDIKIENQYIEFNTDADQLSILKVETEGVPYLQFQVSTATSGSTTGSIDAMYINKIWR